MEKPHSNSQIVIQPAGNGSEDGFVELSDALMSALGWSIGDQVEIEITQEDAFQFTKISAPA